MQKLDPMSYCPKHEWIFCAYSLIVCVIVLEPHVYVYIWNMWATFTYVSEIYLELTTSQDDMSDLISAISQMACTESQGIN